MLFTAYSYPGVIKYKLFISAAKKSERLGYYPISLAKMKRSLSADLISPRLGPARDDLAVRRLDAEALLSSREVRPWSSLFSPPLPPSVTATDGGNFVVCADELIIRIALQLQPQEISKWGKTCRRFNQLMRDNYLWTIYYTTWYGSVLRPGVFDSKERCEHIAALLDQATVSADEQRIVAVCYQADKIITRMITPSSALPLFARLICRSWINPAILPVMWTLIETDPVAMTEFFRSLDNLPGRRILNMPSIRFLLASTDDRVNRSRVEEDYSIHLDDPSRCISEDKLHRVVRTDASKIYQAYFQPHNDAAKVLAAHYQAPRINALTRDFDITTPRDLLNLGYDLIMSVEGYTETMSHGVIFSVINKPAIRYIISRCDEGFWAGCLDLRAASADEGDWKDYQFLLVYMYPYIYSRIPTAAYYRFFNAGYDLTETAHFVSVLALKCPVDGNFSLAHYISDPLGYAAGLPGMVRECTHLLQRVQDSGRKWEYLDSGSVVVGDDFWSLWHFGDVVTWNQSDEGFTVTIGNSDLMCLVELKLPGTDELIYYGAYDEPIILTLGHLPVDDELGTVAYVQLVNE